MRRFGPKVQKTFDSQGRYRTLYFRGSEPVAAIEVSTIFHTQLRLPFCALEFPLGACATCYKICFTLFYFDRNHKVYQKYVQNNQRWSSNVTNLMK